MENNENLERLQQEMSLLKKQIERITKKSEDLTEGVLSEGLAEVEDTLSVMKDGLKNYTEKGKEKIREASQKTQAYAEENPWNVALIAGAVGLVIGYIATRKRD